MDDFITVDSQTRSPRGPLSNEPDKRASGGKSDLFPPHRVKPADLEAFSALDATALIYDMGFAPHSRDARYGAIPGAEGAAHALYRVNFVMNERFALPGGASFIDHMSLVFITEMPERA